MVHPALRKHCQGKSALANIIGWFPAHSADVHHAEILQQHLLQESDFRHFGHMIAYITASMRTRFVSSQSMSAARFHAVCKIACLYWSQQLQGYEVSKPVSMADFQQVCNQLCSTFV